MSEKQYDVIIVGGGPGGLTAGLYTARANRKVAVIEKLQTGGQIANTEDVEDYPGFDHILGPDLAAKMTDHARRFGLEIISDEVSEIYSEDSRHIVLTASGDKYRARAVIISSGGSPNHLKVPGEMEFAGKGVSYCAICDGAFFKDQVIAVVGGGDAAVEEGMFLTKYGSKVYIIHRRNELRAQKIIQQRAFSNPKVEFIFDTVVESIDGDKKVRSLSLRNVKTGEKSKLEVGAIFVFVGFVPNSNLTREPLNLDKGGYIITNERMETSIKGIYACGDVRSQLVRQITNAVGDGTTASVAAEKYMEELDHHETMAASEKK